MTQTTLRDYLQSTEDAISNGRIDEAYEHCQYMLTHFPESLEAQRLLGEVYLAQGQLPDAQQTFDWVLTNDPENVIAYCDRALISERMEDYETALDCYQQAYELSRGNSQIRQEFNTLSAKVGQQSFIFSRAGLARLYMRGDLLPQAIQEWESVLAAAPDRLDARTGLLEAYWREGLYDQVEQLARNILNDIPGCLKSLLLLAHVTFAQNVNASQELLQRAEALDPELTMASELFSDFMASQPHDPFLALLRKEADPSNLTANTQVSPANGATTSNGNGAHGSGSSYHTPEFSESLLRWSSLDNIIEPQQDYQIMQEAAPFTAWTPEQTNGSSNAHAEQPPAKEAMQRNTPVLDNWGGFGQSGANWSAFDTVDVVAPQDEPSRESQSLPSNTVHAPEQAQHEEEPLWYSDIARATDEQKDVPLEDNFSQWSTSNQPGELSTDSAWEARAKEEDVPPPPAWLDVLTRSEQHQQPPTAASTSASSASPAPPASAVPEPFADSPVEQKAPVEKPIQSETSPTYSEQNRESEETPFAFSQDDDEGFSFGPEWLKSLGARSMNSLDGILSEPFDPDTMVPPPTSTTQTGKELPAATQKETEQPVAKPAAKPVAKPAAEPEAVTPQFTDYANSLDNAASANTAESQEPDLSFWEDMTPAPAPATAGQHTFEPESVEPDAIEQTAEPEIPEISPAVSAQQPSSVSSWLEQAAQRLSQPEQNTLTTLEELEKDLRSQGFLPLEPGSLATIAQDQEQVATPSLSSALAQLGEFAPQNPAQTRTTTPLQPEDSPAQPLWIATPEPVAQQQTAPSAAEIPTLSPVQQPQQTRPQQTPAMPSHLDALSSFVAQAKADKATVAKPETKISEQSTQLPPFVASNSASEQVKPAPSMPHEALLDMELETTMKRPSVRLQAMPSQRYGASRGSTGERTSSGKLPDSDLSYKERLLKGYQYQLSGAYDDAMQEYRIIIRNAPELLGEVVSNMRALLKLAPKYSAGYRVLGDAYMRQGEYLQAMEAYNKALTMAKKAKN